MSCGPQLHWINNPAQAGPVIGNVSDAIDPVDDISVLLLLRESELAGRHLKVFFEGGKTGLDLNVCGLIVRGSAEEAGGSVA